MVLSGCNLANVKFDLTNLAGAQFGFGDRESARATFDVFEVPRRKQRKKKGAALPQQVAKRVLSEIYADLTGAEDGEDGEGGGGGSWGSGTHHSRPILTLIIPEQCCSGAHFFACREQFVMHWQLAMGGEIIVVQPGSFCTENHE
jgi:hypothetical protein